MSGQHGGQDEVCLYFLNGLCRFGADCTKSHDPSALRPLCIYFERGSCNRGSSCLYAHGPNDRQPKLAPAGAGGGRGRGGAGRGRGRQPQRGGGRIGGVGRARQHITARQGQPPPADDPLQVYRDATEEELDMLEELEEAEARRQAVEAHERLQRLQQAESAVGEEAATEAAVGKGAGQEGGKDDASQAAEGEEKQAASKVTAAGGGSNDGEAEVDQGNAVAAATSSAAAGEGSAAAEQDMPALCSEHYGKVVTTPFLPTNWCVPCRRSFTTPDGLLKHLKAKHKQDSERIAALQALRRCPCGREFEFFSQLSSHISKVHCKPTAAQREGAAIGDALFRMAMMGGLRGGYDSSDEDDYGFGGYGGFSGADVEELLCQGVKPWDDDAADVLAVLNGDFDDYGYF